jgi:hypothetical protein
MIPGAGPQQMITFGPPVEPSLSALVSMNFQMTCVLNRHKLKWHQKPPRFQKHVSESSHGSEDSASRNENSWVTMIGSSQLNGQNISRYCVVGSIFSHLDHKTDCVALCQSRKLILQASLPMLPALLSGYRFSHRWKLQISWTKGLCELASGFIMFCSLVPGVCAFPKGNMQPKLLSDEKHAIDHEGGTVTSQQVQVLMLVAALINAILSSVSLIAAIISKSTSWNRCWITQKAEFIFGFLSFVSSMMHVAICEVKISKTPSLLIA